MTAGSLSTSETPKETPKETVIVVHGTWAAPRTDSVGWYQPHDGVSATDHFTARLDAELQKRGSPARCWAHCTDAHPPFHWSGKNSWIERTHAAVALADEVARLKNAGWLCHIVAHSHGGNVAVEALQQVTVGPGAAGASGKLVTLGTPFLDAMAPIVGRAALLKRILNVAFIATTALAIIVEIAGGVFWYWESPIPARQKVEMILGLLVFTAAIMGFSYFVLRPYFLRRAERRKRSTFQGPRAEAPAGLLDDWAEAVFTAQGKAASSQAPLQVSLLAISSPMDEAWQVLHHLRSLENPLAIRKSLVRYLFDAMRSYMSEGAAIARIHGARSYGDLGKAARLNLVLVYFACVAALVPASLSSRTFGAWPIGWLLLFMPPFLVIALSKTYGPAFLSAFLSPFRWIGRWVGCLIAIPAFLSTYIVRRKSWSVLLEMAMGMEGYRFSLPAIARWPRSFPKEFVTYEDMPAGAEARAMDKRSGWIARHLGGVSQTFAKMVISPADLWLLLATIEQDQSLIHAAYYTDDACIARIADRIAGVR